MILLFSFGTKNSGTAMRHRLKVVPLIFVVYAVASDSYVAKKIKEK